MKGMTPWAVSVMRGAIRLRSGHLLGARTEHDKDGAQVRVSWSQDQGKTWRELGVLTQDPDSATDLGDGAFLDSKRHGLLYVCRHNHHAAKSYAIRVHQSRDGGKSWKPHSTAFAADHGLWAPVLVETPKGELLCVYDDEDTPARQGFPGHQWLSGRFWDGKVWGSPVTLSRATDPKHLSRDGMGTVVAVGEHLLCALESVDTAPPHPGCLRLVESHDGGHTWEPRRPLYQPAKRPHMALAPCLARLGNGTLVCVFGTDEDRELPDKPGTPPPQLHQDLKAVVSRDQGKSWSAPRELYTGTHRNYLAGLVPLNKDTALLVWIDFDKSLLAQEVRF